MRKQYYYARTLTSILLIALHNLCTTCFAHIYLLLFICLNSFHFAHNILKEIILKLFSKLNYL